MSETSKTFAFLAAGVASVAAAVFVGRGSAPPDVQELVGKRLNEYDLEAPKSLRIVRYNADKGDVDEFEVTERQGVWTIPSKQGYPADATTQMAEASICLMDREILDVKTELAQDHQSLGVIDPMSSKIAPKGEGVGLRVVMKDADEKTLVDMIIGKKVKDSDDQYYVRKSSQDVVYVVQLEPEKLTTDFSDWIEEDLLQLNALDIQKMFIDDYSASIQLVLQNGRIQSAIDWDRRGEMTLAYDDSASAWSAESLMEFQGDPVSGAMVEYELGPNEELNEDALRELRNGLDDLQIVDVERKPSGLSGDLKAGEEFLTNREAVENLSERGFVPVGVSGVTEIISSEGQIVCTMKDGVEYVLRFGQLQVGEGDGELADEAASEETPSDIDANAEDAADEGAAGINRYLFVVAQFNDAAIAKPALQDVPVVPNLPSQEDAADDVAADDAGSATVQADEASVADADESADGASEGGEEQATDENAPTVDPELQARLDERDRIVQENQRLQDQYDEQVASGKERVAMLNERFGDWYYVISNDFFKQIRLDRDGLIKPKEQTPDDQTSDASGLDGPLSGFPNLPLPAGVGGEDPAANGGRPDNAASVPADGDADEATASGDDSVDAGPPDNGAAAAAEEAREVEQAATSSAEPSE